MTPQSMAAEMTSEVMVPDHKRRTRSKSASRVQTNFTPVSFEGSSSSRRKGRESQRAMKDSRWRPEVSPRREASFSGARAHMPEVHPIKLQPQIADSSRNSPHCVIDKCSYGELNKPATSPHVRCRVDIMPDDMALHQSRRKKTTKSIDIPCQRQQNIGSRSLTVPRHFSYLELNLLLTLWKERVGKLISIPAACQTVTCSRWSFRYKECLLQVTIMVENEELTPVPMCQQNFFMQMTQEGMFLLFLMFLHNVIPIFMMTVTHQGKHTLQKCTTYKIQGLAWCML
ncbi:uncharacterized protein FQA47_000973 [Oryzias melastigma]|uniref:Uncharacterized protein n=1 Tax=Oryzias melastigma TaxID=30732 RepID=A0A834BRW4_ORYME|nr:uncharacterized protein FQA47_000973 [Oryzias melastigma]